MGVGSQQLLLFETEVPPGKGSVACASLPVVVPRTELPSTALAPEVALARRLEPLLDSQVVVVLTDNKSRILSARPSEAGLTIRLHKAFADAPEPVLRAIARLARRSPGSRAPRPALAVLRAHHAQAHPPPDGARVRPGMLQPVGQTLDLRVVRDEINAARFEGALDVAISWGAAPRRRRRIPRSIRLGSFDPRTRVIRIHRALDTPDVPRYVVASIIHHELLHAAMPPEPCGLGRRVVHSAAFRARERAYEHHERSEAWIEKNLSRLLRAAIPRARRSNREKPRGR